MERYLHEYRGYGEVPIEVLGDVERYAHKVQGDVERYRHEV